jgi:hypothetical protein
MNKPLTPMPQLKRVYKNTDQAESPLAAFFGSNKKSLGLAYPEQDPEKGVTCDEK